MLRIVLSSALLASLAVPASLSSQDFDAPVRYEDDFLSADFHRSRRDAVMATLPENGVALFFGAPTRNRSNDVDFEYRQSSDFLYLTGSSEPGSALILAPGGVAVDGVTVREILFVPPRDPSREAWLGRRFGTERAMEQLGVELAVEATRFSDVVAPLLQSDAYEIFHLDLPSGVEEGTELAAQVGTFLQNAEPVVIAERGIEGYVLRGMLAAQTPEAFARVKGISARGFTPAQVSDPDLRNAAEAFVAAGSLEEWSARREEVLGDRPDGIFLRAVLDELRTIKTEEELAVLRRAIDITAEAHREVMRKVKPGWKEYEIEALVEYTFKRSGAEYTGYPSIVGSGENSVILHYESNRRTTEPGDVVVIDIGAEFHGYSADVTRTVPVDGTYSDEQRAIYELVYRAQEAGIAAARSSNSLRAPNQAATRVLAAGLAELGLISDPSDQQGLRRFFMHGTSHYLGLDVHDVGSGGPMEPGTVITVEPGIYIPAAEDIDPKWWNIGVRIEDDVLVTDGDPVILSASVPRQIDEVEALMRSRPISEQPTGSPPRAATR
jgi:Xaa-Pro aminopeptidase